MKKFDKTFEDKLEQTIEAIEEKTSVEVVVAVTPESDSYIDAYFKGGLVFLFIMLIVLLYAPVYFPEYMVPIDLAVSFGFGILIVWLFPPFKRFLTGSTRRKGYVNAAANTFFRENGLVETIERTAFLVYISVFEKKCRLIADKGILSAIPAGEWVEIETNFNGIFSRKELAPQAILDTLATVVEPFSKYLPPAEDNIDELSNRLRRVGE